MKALLRSISILILVSTVIFAQEEVLNYFDAEPLDPNYWNLEISENADPNKSFTQRSFTSTNFQVGSGAMRIDWGVHDSEVWGGEARMAHFHSEADEVYDLSGLNMLTLWYYVDVPSSDPGTVHLRIILMDVSNSPSGNNTYDRNDTEYYYSFNYVLDDTPGWNQLKIPLRADPNYWNGEGFNRTGWVGIEGNNTLDLDKIKGYTIEFNKFVDNNNGTGNNFTGSITLDHLIADDDPIMSISQPNGGEVLIGSTEYSIRWTGKGVNDIDIKFTDDNGTSWSDIIAGYDFSLDEYSWTVPNSISSQCKIRLIESGGSGLYDESELPFEIVAGANIDITFQCDMSLENMYGRFWPTGDILSVRGDFNGWSSGDNMIQSAGDPNIYEKTITLPVYDGQSVEYKFTHEQFGTNDYWEHGDNKTVLITATDISSGSKTISRIFDDLDPSLFKENVMSFNSEIINANVYSATGANWEILDENYVSVQGGWEQPNSFGLFSRGLNRVSNVQQVVIYGHPDYHETTSATVANYIVNFPKSISTSYGLIDGQSLGSVRFLIQVFNGVTYTTILDDIVSSNVLKDFTFDLSTWNTDQITIRFITDPNGVPHEDWAVWVDPIVEIETNFKRLGLNAFLEGPFNTSNSNMDKNLSSNIPKTSPFVEDIVTVQTVPNSAVDWVLVQVRNKTTPSNIIASESAFVLNTGQIVDLDGTSSVAFSVPDDDYYVSIKHRNHLSVMSKDPVDLSGSATAEAVVTKISKEIVDEYKKN